MYRTPTIVLLLNIFILNADRYTYNYCYYYRMAFGLLDNVNLHKFNVFVFGKNDGHISNIYFAQTSQNHRRQPEHWEHWLRVHKGNMQIYHIRNAIFGNTYIYLSNHVGKSKPITPFELRIIIIIIIVCQCGSHFNSVTLNRSTGCVCVYPWWFEYDYVIQRSFK